MELSVRYHRQVRSVRRKGESAMAGGGRFCLYSGDSRKVGSAVNADLFVEQIDGMKGESQTHGGRGMIRADQPRRNIGERWSMRLHLTEWRRT